MTDRDDQVAVIEAANRAYLLAYRRNARLMRLLEQVANINDDDVRELRRLRGAAFAQAQRRRHPRAAGARARRPAARSRPGRERAVGGGRAHGHWAFIDGEAVGLRGAGRDAHAPVGQRCGCPSPTLPRGGATVTDPNRQIRLARPPRGAGQAVRLGARRGAGRRAGDGEFAGRTKAVSLDPAMRGWLDDKPSYVPRSVLATSCGPTASSRSRSRTIRGSRPATTSSASSGPRRTSSPMAAAR